MIGSGFSWGVIAGMAYGVSTQMYWAVAGVLGRIAAANCVVGIVIGVSTAAAIYSMGTWRIF